MLSNEVFARACRAYYEEQGFIVDHTNGEFAHCPQPERYGSSGYYLLWEHHQHQGLLQSQDIGECCFFAGDAKKWLLECNYFPSDFFTLWDIYEKYSKIHQSVAGKKGAKRMNEIIHSEKDENGKSKHAVNIGKKGGQIGGSKGGRKGGKAGGRKVKVTLQNGSQIVFSSITEAGDYFSISGTYIKKRIREGLSRRGKLLGIKFEFAG
jgi:hypothetical protein